MFATWEILQKRDLHNFPKNIPSGNFIHFHNRKPLFSQIFERRTNVIIIQGYLLTLFEGTNTTHLNYALSITHYALFYAL